MPYGKKLTDEEIRQRLIRLSNLERLYTVQVAANTELKAENTQLKAQLVAVADRFESLFQKQQIRIAELEKMVFGSRPTKIPPQAPSSDGQGGGASGTTPPKKQRSAASFRRSVPGEQEITATSNHPVRGCGSCGGPLDRIRDHVRYMEDIVLPVLDPAASAKTVTKQYIQSGWCTACQTTTYGDEIDLRGQQVVLGSHVRLLTTYFLTILEMTYSQMVVVFRDLYGLAVSEGELAAMAAKQGVALLPEREVIARSIREGPGTHLDETSYKIFSQGMGWAWCMGSTANEDVIYHLAESRGKNHVKELLETHATNMQGVHVHDCYAAYQQLDTTGSGQTCWSHYYRVVRDLAQLDAETLGSAAAQEHCTQAKAELGTIYADLRQYLNEPFDQTVRGTQRTTLQARIDWFCVPDPNDPDKLKKLKARMQQWRHTLLTCLTTPNIPADNNKAERHIRKLVLKRKKSFGVRNLKTAKTLSILMSVVHTYANRNKQQPGRLLPALASLVRR